VLEKWQKKQETAGKATKQKGRGRGRGRGRGVHKG